MSAIVSRPAHVDFEELTPELVRELANEEAMYAARAEETDIDVLLRQTRAEIDAMVEGRMRTLAARYDARIAVYAQKVQDGEAKLAHIKSDYEAAQQQLHVIEGRLRSMQDWAKGFDSL